MISLALNMQNLRIDDFFKKLKNVGKSVLQNGAKYSSAIRKQLILPSGYHKFVEIRFTCKNRVSRNSSYWANGCAIAHCVPFPYFVIFVYVTLSTISMHSHLMALKKKRPKILLQPGTEKYCTFLPPVFMGIFLKKCNVCVPELFKSYMVY